MDQAKRRLEITAKRLIYTETAYGILLLGLEKSLTDSVQTASVKTTGINKILRFNPAFIDSLGNDDLYGIYMHQILHIILFHVDHLHRFKNQKLANLAADLVANQYIPERYKPNQDMAFDDFIKQLEAWEENPVGPRPVRPIKLDDVGLGAFPKESLKFYYDKLNYHLESGQLPTALLEQGSFDDPLEPGDPEEEELNVRQIESWLKSAASHPSFKGAWGNLPGDVQELLDRILNPRPPVADWKSIFRDLATGSSKTETYQSRRRPSYRHPKSPKIKVIEGRKILFAVDTSMSVDQMELGECYQELDHIADAGVEITVIHADTKIQKILDWSEVDQTAQIEVYGRGGTNFNDVMEYYNAHKNAYSLLIYFTDGYASEPKPWPEKHMLWLLSSRGKQPEEMRTYPGAAIKMENLTQNQA